MKRIAKTIAIVTLASAMSAAVAANTEYPSSSGQEIPMSSEFPNMPTYKSEHRNDVAQQSATSTYPAEVPEDYSLYSEFPNMQTYKQEHRNDPVQPTPPYPYSVPD
jgi:hypothetical protein